jgi:sirohydrochlorin ferrochelatase
MTALILLAHGSRSSKATDEVASLATGLNNNSSRRPVTHAFLEMADPTLEQTVIRLIDEDICAIEVLPLFLNSGNHVMRDIPEMASRLRLQFSQLELRILPHIGSHSGFSDLVAAVALAKAS